MITLDEFKVNLEEAIDAKWQLFPYTYVDDSGKEHIGKENKFVVVEDEAPSSQSDAVMEDASDVNPGYGETVGQFKAHGPTEIPVDGGTLPIVDGSDISKEGAQGGKWEPGTKHTIGELPESPTVADLVADKIKQYLDGDQDSDAVGYLDFQPIELATLLASKINPEILGKHARRNYVDTTGISS